MAKKIKQKKGSLKKRQHEKKHKKMLRRKKTMASRINNSLDSSKKFESLMNSLPNLAFDDKLIDLNFDEKYLNTLREENKNETEIINNLVTIDFKNELEKRLIEIETNTKFKSPKNILSKASLHQIRNEVPYFCNPLIVAIYFKTLSKIDGEQLSLQNLSLKIKEFELRNEDIIKATSLKEEQFQKNEDPPKKIKFPQKIIEDYYNELSRTENSKGETMKEDIEVFFEDFGPPPPEEWTPKLIYNFINNWFVKESNPTNDDINSMRDTMLHFSNFLSEKKLISENLFNDINKNLLPFKN